MTDTPSNQPELSIDAFALGMWQTNCYIVAVGKQCWLVDVGFEPGPMLDAVEDRGLHVEKIVLTHAHLDHIGGLHEAKRRFPDAPILIHKDETTFLADPALNLSVMHIEPVIAPEADGELSHGQTLSLGGIDFDIRHTPGHSPGGITLYQPESGVALVGDTLFAGSIGRHDFPTSDGPTLMRSIHEQLMSLPDDVQVLPGHGPASTIGQERKSNPFLVG